MVQNLIIAQGCIRILPEIQREVLFIDQRRYPDPEPACFFRSTIAKHNRSIIGSCSRIAIRPHFDPEISCLARREYLLRLSSDPVRDQNRRRTFPGSKTCFRICQPSDRDGICRKHFAIFPAEGRNGGRDRHACFCGHGNFRRRKIVPPDIDDRMIQILIQKPVRAFRDR